ncbi:MAG: LPXTG cell wall anchor domain-containing protein [Thioalkalivibrio sp.]|nr:LPXTG cell wall anchor domain-containing protein [Thioalkalivibrio sp.]
MNKEGTAVSGSIVSVSDDVIVVRTDAGETMRFNRDSSVNVPSNLTAGTRVSVEYNRLTADNMRLTRIALADDADTRRTTGDRATTSGTTGNNTYGSGNAADDNTTGYSRLPRTASPLMLMALAGLVSLGGAMALRVRRRR